MIIKDADERKTYKISFEKIPFTRVGKNFQTELPRGQSTRSSDSIPFIPTNVDKMSSRILVK